MLSMKAKYAIRALMVMAKNEKKMLASKSIAGEADVPQKFLDNILQELRHHGLVDSKRGIFGGYFLAQTASKIKVGDVIRIMDGPLAPIRCASVTAYQKCDDCVDEASCQIRKVMIDVRNSIAGVLDKKPSETWWEKLYNKGGYMIDQNIPADVEKHILKAIQGIRFGAVEVLIHDSRVVQIERSEKTRFDGKKS